ncbi:MAG: hypothetical protein PF692_03950 [Kiritimatiellae bacterium]|jgi:hypothetical protein|nr:hypothetical protein [Kiritimatiellia bacterium]
MNKVLAGIALMVITATSSFAQYCGVPLADNIAPKEAGTFGIDFISTNQKNAEGSTAARFNYTIFSGLNVFGDVGLVGFSDFSVQSGLLYTLPLETPFNIGIRGTLGYIFGDYDASSYSATVVAGYTIPSIAWLSLYAQFGIANLDGSGDSETGFLGSIGTMFNYDEALSFFVEYGVNEALPSDSTQSISIGVGLDM